MVIKFCVILFLILIGLSTNAQKFEYGIRTSFIKIDIDQYSTGAQLFPENFSDGFEIGGLVSFKPSKTLFLFQSGITFTHQKYEYYDLNYGSVPVNLDIEIGKKAGVFLGPGFRLWYLLKVPENPYKYDYNRFLYSWNARLGVFFTVKNLKFQFYPQLEFVKTPVYTTGSWRGGTVEYELIMTSYNLTIQL